MNRLRPFARVICTLVLGAWLVGLAVAAVKLDAWNKDMVETLLRIRADTALRDRMAAQREPMPSGWYRAKALELVAAAEKLQYEPAWAAFIPGSWRVFDNVRERAGMRIERAFGEIAVETVRRELHSRASELTGVPLDGHTGEPLAAEGCAGPATRVLKARAGASLRPPEHELPEFLAVQMYLAELSQLDHAIGALLALQTPGGADTEYLRDLVRYTLGTELPARLVRTAPWFRRGLKPPEAAQAALTMARLQQAARCSLLKAMGALDNRLFERDELLASEAELAQQATRLWAAGSGPTNGEGTEALREVITALRYQERLLARWDYAWMHSATPSLGPAHEALLVQVGEMTQLLGPEAAEEVRAQSELALARFRQHFAAAFRNADQPSLVWAQDSGRLVFSPERVALRDSLIKLARLPSVGEVP